MPFSTEYSIIAQNSANVAATLLANAEFTDTDELLTTFEKVRLAVFQNTIALAESGTGPVDRRQSRGAGAPTKGRTVISFGKHAGKTVDEIVAVDRSYVEWLSESAKEDRVRVAAKAALRDAASAPAVPDDLSDNDEPF